MSRSIAFYAPLKSPKHSTPSGDRTMAQGLMAGLGQIGEVELVSELRSRDGVGDVTVQAGLIEKAGKIAAELIERGTWDAWVTYHNYYKAPDLIGPAVCLALGIPYHLIEASRAAKRLSGPWEGFAKRADAASDAAQVIYYFTERDRPSLASAKPVSQQLVSLKPFLDRDAIDAVVKPAPRNAMLAVGMFRQGDKLASYTNLAQALALVRTPNWTLDIVGAGEAEAEIRDLFSPFGAKVRYLGQLAQDAVLRQMALADVFLWPGVNEAFGMVYLEAQAAGTPVVAEDRAGVRDVVGPANRLAAADNAADFALGVDAVLESISNATVHQKYIEDHHLRGSAVAVFRDTLQFKRSIS